MLINSPIETVPIDSPSDGTARSQIHFRLVLDAKNPHLDKFHATSIVSHALFRKFIDQVGDELTVHALRDDLFFDGQSPNYPSKHMYDKLQLYYRDYLQDVHGLSLFQNDYQHVLQIIFYRHTYFAEFVGSPIKCSENGFPTESVTKIPAPYVILEWCWKK